MSLKQYNWTDGEVITAEKLNRGGVTIVGETTETNEGTMRITLDMTLQEIYDAMGKGIVVLINSPQEGTKVIAICVSCALAKEDVSGFAVFRSGSKSFSFDGTTNDSFPYMERVPQG